MRLIYERRQGCLLGAEKMKMKLHRQAGFSLTEVMFAVLILAMGLVFVACQFPVALSLCRDIVDNTRGVVESHNSQMMIELKLREANLDMIVDRRLATFEPGDFHMLLKPNVLANTRNNASPILVVDDLEHDPMVMSSTSVCWMMPLRQAPAAAVLPSAPAPPQAAF